MAIFDPRPFGPIPADLSVVPTHGESWRRKFANWWGGATIASPTRAMVQPAHMCLNTIRGLVDDPAALAEFYARETEYARQWVRQVLMTPSDEPVIFDASGTAAILTASRIFSHLAVDGERRFWTLTTDEGGSLVPATLKGRNPNELEKVMFQPVTSLFYNPDMPVLNYPDGANLSSRILRIGESTNTEIVEAIRQAVESQQGPGCIMLPHVTKTGRILPIREVGQLVDSLRAAGRQVFYIVDDIQGIGRLPIEAVANPTSFCDAYLYGSSKALGGILIASVVVMRRALLQEFAGRAVLQVPGPAFFHFQFSAEWEERFGLRLLKNGAVSLPEVVSMRAGLYQLWLRGAGETFSERRFSQLEHVRALRKQVVDGLTTLKGVSVLEALPDRPVVPSIVCVEVDRSLGSPMGIKKALQEGDPIVTPSAPIGGYVRLDIPEYRAMPSVDVLVDKLGRVVLK